MKVISFSIGFFFAALSFVHGQDLVDRTGDCTEYHEKNCKKLPEGFERNGQSQSALFAVGDTSELRFVAYGGHDYRIDVCQSEIFPNEVRFRILTTEMKKMRRVKLDTSGFNNRKDTIVSYRKKEVVLYDNEKDDNSKSLEFSNPDNTRNLTIQVIAKGEAGKSNKFKSRDMGCIGVSIGHAPSKKTGFR